MTMAVVGLGRSSCSEDPGEGLSYLEHRTNAALDLTDVLEEERRAECLALVTSYLEHQIAMGASIGSLEADAGDRRRSPFHNRCQPHISLRDYVLRLSKFTRTSSVCFIIACSYIDRLTKVDELYRVTRQTSHRLILCGVLLAAKLTDDKFRSNAYFSKVGGVSKAVLNEMELHMFRKLDFTLYTTEAQIKQQVLLMAEAVNVKLPGLDIKDGSSIRRSKKRVSEDVGFGSEDDLPAKLPHGDEHSAVHVTMSRDASLLPDLENVGQVLRAVLGSDGTPAALQSGLANCAQELNASERSSSLKSPASSSIPGA